jgi:hypothetical protein
VVAAINATTRNGRSRRGGGRIAAVIDRVSRACEQRCRPDFAELRRLEQSFERRAVIQSAKGVLMAIHGIGGEDAYILLRDHSRRTNQKLAMIAEAVLKSHVLLGRQQHAVATRSSGAAERTSSAAPRPEEELAVSRRR